MMVHPSNVSFCNDVTCNLRERPIFYADPCNGGGKVDSLFPYDVLYILEGVTVFFQEFRGSLYLASWSRTPSSSR